MDINFSTDKIIQGKNHQSSTYSITENPRQINTTGFTAEHTVEDCVRHAQVLSDSVNECSIIPDSLEDSIFEAITPDVATIDIEGGISYIQDGDAEFTLVQSNKAKLRFERQMQRTQEVGPYMPKYYLAGTVGEHIHQQMTAFMQGKVQTIDTERHQVVTYENGWDNPTVIPNPNSFTAEIDWSGINVSRDSDLPERYPLVLITPRHAFTAWHITSRYAVGTQVVFRRPDGNFQIATVTARTRVASGVDLGIIYFDQDITGCSIFKVVPQDFFTSFVPSASNSGSDSGHSTQVRANLPFLRKAMHYTDSSWGDTFQINHVSYVSTTSINNTMNYSLPAFAEFDSWGIRAIGGDSGGPSFFLINNEPILFTAQYTVLGASNLSSFISVVNTIMNTQAGTTNTYALQHPDLSGFTNFNPVTEIDLIDIYALVAIIEEATSTRTYNAATHTWSIEQTSVGTSTYKPMIGYNNLDTTKTYRVRFRVTNTGSTDIRVNRMVGAIHVPINETLTAGQSEEYEIITMPHSVYRTIRLRLVGWEEAYAIINADLQVLEFVEVV